MILFLFDNRVSSQYKYRRFRYRDSHYEDDTVVRSSYLYNESFSTGKAASLDWDGPQTAGKVGIGL